MPKSSPTHRLFLLTTANNVVEFGETAIKPGDVRYYCYEGDATWTPAVDGWIVGMPVPRTGKTRKGD